MQIYRLRQEEKELFDWLDPFNFMDRMAIPNYFTLAACVKDEDGGDVPAGVLVGNVGSNRITVEWMCVAPELRGQGIGDGLLDKLFETAGKKNISEVAVRFIDDSDVRKVEENVVDYFTGQMFWTDEDHPGEWDIFVNKLKDNPYFQDDRSKYPDAVSLDAVKHSDVVKAISVLGGKNDAISLFDMEAFSAAYDPKLSVALFSDDEPCGLLLSIRSNDTCYPVFFYAETERERKAMLLKAAECVQREMPEDGNIRIIAADDLAAEIADSIFPDEMIRSEILVAETDDV